MTDGAGRQTRRMALMGLAALAGCGFTPAYGPRGGAGRLTGRVALAVPDDRAAYLLAQRIEERLGRAGSPAYRLDTALRLRTEGLGISPDNRITRFNLIGEAEYSLSEIGTGAALTQGRVTSFTGYSATGSTVATLTAERDAEARLMTILADQIVARLLAYAPGLPG